MDKLKPPPKAKADLERCLAEARRDPAARRYRPPVTYTQINLPLPYELQGDGKLSPPIEGDYYTKPNQTHKHTKPLHNGSAGTPEPLGTQGIEERDDQGNGSRCLKPPSGGGPGMAPQGQKKLPL